MQNSTRRRILVLVDWYVPGYKAGGPIRSVANIVNKLKGEFDFSVITRNTDYLDPAPYPGIESDQWVHSGQHVKIWYFSSARLNWKNLLHLLSTEKYDVVYLNSFFSFYFSLLPIFILKYRLQTKARVILAPRGMLAANALNIKKLKKRFLINLSNLVGLHRNIIWHGSSVLEANEIRAVFPNAEVKVALNIPTPVEFKWKERDKAAGEARMFFVSRIAIKKNLQAALLALSNVKTSYRILFDIYGPIDEDTYWEQCKATISRLPGNIQVSYKGALDHSSMQAIMQEYHFMLFPTLNENYGHVILESLASGCPVIISDQTPWRNLEEKRAGWDISLSNMKQFTNVIERCAAMDQQEYNEWSKDAFDYAAGFLYNEEIIRQNKELFM